MISAMNSADAALAAGHCGNTELVEAIGAAWLQSPATELYEQAQISKNGRALTLRWATLPTSEYDNDGEF